MKKKRLAALLLALALAAGVSLPAFPALGLATAAAAIPARDANDQYFGRQLTGAQALGTESRAFYDAMVAMYKNGKLITGEDQAVQLSDEQVQGSNLGHALTNARDAFYLDYPDLFYVNFNNFALRNWEGTIYITPGTRGTGYLLDGIEPGAVPGLEANYDASLAELVAAGTAATPTAAESSQQAAAVRAVHDKLAEMLTYKLDNECAPENQKYIRTAYGIVTGEGVCEAYSRAFKSAMDSLGIPCVLVEGAFRHSADLIEAHMWALVQVEDKWYGVDVTMDDPDKPIVDAYGESTGGTAYDDYLLAGDVTMSAQHAASDTMSAASYKFTYPELTQNDYGVVTMHNSGGLEVKLDTTDNSLGHEGSGGSGAVHVSYNGMNYTNAAKNGYYILARCMTVSEDAHFEGSDTTKKGTYEWSATIDWGYLCPELFGAINEDDATETILPMPHVRYVQFAVTDVAPGDYSQAGSADEIYKATHYLGDPSLLLAKTDVLFNPGGDYVAPPYIERAWPTQQSTMLIGQTYQIEAKMDDKLVPAEEGAQLGYTLTTYAFIKGKREDYSAEKYCTIGPLKLKDNDDGTSSITFEFTPSEQWAHDTIFYEFNFTGVVGETSKKKPNSLVYLASHPCTAYAYQSQGFDWNLYGKPQLMDDFENSDISIENWETKDGTKLPDELKHRMTLVVSNTTPDQKADMEAMAERQAGKTPAASETYSINLTVCKKQVVSTGQAVRVMLGFPEEYGPDDVGVTFKAYHYSVDALGNITGINEIPCIVTPQGLLVLCDSFSPFNICAFKGLQEEPKPGETEGSKDIVISTSCGGGEITVSGAEVKSTGVYTAKPGETYTVTVKAPAGKQIGAITLGDRVIKVTDPEMVTFDIIYDDLPELTSGVLDVQFVTKEWIENSQKDPEAKPEVTVTLPEAMSLKEGDTLKLTADVKVTTPGASTPETATAETADAYTYTYRWFKDGAELPDKTGKTLTVPAVKAVDAGVYTVEVVLTDGEGKLVAEAVSKTGCTVTVETEAGPEPTASPETTPEPGTPPKPDTTPKPGTTPKPDTTPVPTPAPTPVPTPVPAAPQAPPADEHPEIAEAIANGTWGQPDEVPAPEAPAAPAAPAVPAAPAATSRPAGGGSGSGNNNTGTILPPATPTPSPSATPAPALSNTPTPMPTPKPTPAPAEPTPEATVAPTATPAPETAKGGIPPLAVGGIAAAGLAVVGGLLWMFLPRRKH